MGDFSALAIRIKQLRTSMEKTQREFAKHVGCTAATLSAYENGSKSPSLEIVKNIAEKCNVSIDWLCGLSERMRNDDTPQTYADIIDLLIKMQYAFGAFHFGLDEDKHIIINDEVMDFFLHDWAKMLPVYFGGVIDRKIYNIWLNEQKNIFSTPLKNHEEIKKLLSYLRGDDESIDEPPQE